VSHAMESLTQFKAKGIPNQVAQAEAKLEAEASKERYLSDKFSALEAEVHNEMLDLIRFILDLRKYIFRAVQILQDSLAAITALFDFSAAPIALAIPPLAHAGDIQTAPPTQPQQQPEPQPQAAAAAGGYDHIAYPGLVISEGYSAKQFYHSISVM